MADQPGDPGNDDHEQPGQEVAGQGEQGVQRIQKGMTICYMCHGGNRM